MKGDFNMLKNIKLNIEVDLMFIVKRNYKGFRV